MLILERYLNQVIIIDDVIRLTILHVGTNKVKLGFDAPKDVPIHREEIWHKLKTEEQ